MRACTHLKDGTPIAITGAGGYFGGAGEVIVWNRPWDECSKRLPAYPVGALCCNSGRGVAIGTATEIVALQHQHSGVHQGRTGVGLSVKVITVRYHPLRREFSLTEGPAPGTRSCLGSLAAAFSAGSWPGQVVNGGDVSQPRRMAVVIHRPCHRALRGGSLRGRRGGQSPR